MGRRLKPEETVVTKYYQQQLSYLNCVLNKKRPEYQKRQHKVILLHDNAPLHMTNPDCNMLEIFSWEVLPHVAQSADLAPSNYHLFASMGYALAKQCFSLYKDIKKWLGELFTAKRKYQM